MDPLVERLGHQFADRAILVLALRHRSWCAEHSGSESNERLEFLGDAVLGLVVTDHVYQLHPEMSEGDLAKVRAAVVSEPALADVAAQMELGDALLLGKGEDATGGREKASILADSMEAVIGAVYLDGGYDAVEALLVPVLQERVAAAAAGPGDTDYKTRLQELAAHRFDQLPRYAVTEEGPDHAKRFHATVRVGGRVVGEGEGGSKKRAEQAAAQGAVAELIVDPVVREASDA